METRPSDSPATLLPTAPSIAELDRLGDEIAELSAHLEAATARLLDLIREFDARGGWNTGFRSCAAWLAWRVGLDPGAARERVRVARALGTLPALAEALARGELSYAKVRALTRVATPETEARLLAVGRAGTAHHVERIVRGWRRVDRQAEAREAARQHAGRALHVYQDEDGTVVLRGRLTPEVGALLLRALDAARETLYQRRRATEAGPPATDPARSLRPGRSSRRTRWPCWPRRRCITSSIPAPRGSGIRWWSTWTPRCWRTRISPGNRCWKRGAHVSAETSRRLACDASRVVMRHDEDGRVVEVGARTRTIPPALRRALQHRDRGCRFPGCHVRIGQGHHVRHWAQGGPTTLVEPGAALSPPSSGGARGGLPDRAIARRGAPVPEAGRSSVAGRAAAGGGAGRSGRGAAGAARGAGAPAACADGVPGLAGGAAGRGLGDRRAASAGHASRRRGSSLIGTWSWWRADGRATPPKH